MLSFEILKSYAENRKKRINLTPNRVIVVNLQTFTNSELEEINSASQKVSETTLKMLLFKGAGRSRIFKKSIFVFLKISKVYIFKNIIPKY